VTSATLRRRFVVLRALRWLPLGVALPFLILLPQERGLSLAEVGLVFGVHSVIAIVAEVPSGGFADATGRRTALLAGGLLTVISLAGFAIATAFAGFAAAVAAMALGRALMSGALEAWFVDELQRLDPEASLHEPLAAGSTAEGIGSGLGAAAGGFLPLAAAGLLPGGGDAFLVELSAPLVAGALAAVVYTLAVLRFVDEHRPPRAPGWCAAAAETLALTRAGLGAARRSRNVRLILGVALALGAVMSTTEVLWPSRLDDLADGRASEVAPLFGLLTAATMLAFSAGSALSSRVARAAGKRRAYAGALVVLAIALLGLIGAPTVVAFCLAHLAYFTMLGIVDPLHYEVLHDAIDSSTRATVASAEGLASQAGGLGGNFGLVPLAGAAGFGAAWGIAAGIAVGAALLAAATAPAAAARPRPRPAAPSGAA
jgi:MFS family permease